MAQHGLMRSRPAELVPNTLRIISARMDYLPPNAGFAQTLQDPTLGYIWPIRARTRLSQINSSTLKKLGEKIEQEIGQLGFRPFVDSAPVLERPLAGKSRTRLGGQAFPFIKRARGILVF